jgi:hypothetical protein
MMADSTEIEALRIAACELLAEVSSNGPTAKARERWVAFKHAVAQFESAAARRMLDRLPNGTER